MKDFISLHLSRILCCCAAAALLMNLQNTLCDYVINSVCYSLTSGHQERPGHTPYTHGAHVT